MTAAQFLYVARPAARLPPQGRPGLAPPPGGCYERAPEVLRIVLGTQALQLG